MEIRVKGVVRIGRGADNDIALWDRRLSRRHCRICREGDELYVEDLGSINGTCVNGEPVIGRRVLRDGDVVSAGSHSFEVRGNSLRAKIQEEVESEPWRSAGGASGWSAASSSARFPKARAGR